MEYRYDAWGRPTSKTGPKANSLGTINPFRYRGYVLDEDVGLYYLRSRYYNPWWGRFISADNEMVLRLNQGNITQYNLYCYCLNNPINRYDANGDISFPNWAKVLLGVAVIAGLAVAATVTTGVIPVICGAALSGAVSSGISGAAIGAVSGGIMNGWQGMLDGASTGFMHGVIMGGATGALMAGCSMASYGTVIHAKAHGAPLHKLATNIEAGKLLSTGSYSDIGINTALKTLGLQGSQRPDVIGIGIYRNNVLVEVISPKQSIQYIENKMVGMLMNNQSAEGKIIYWVRYIYGK